MKLKNLVGHTKTVLTHKFWVAHFCFKCGLYWQGITHDLSKFSPTEFWESVKYYDGTRSPIDACKEQNGISWAWLHHRGRNRHHWEMYLDNFENGTTTIKMPWRYALEMVCDFLGAGVAYSGGIKNFSMEDEIKWWKKKREVAIIHPDTVWLVDTLFEKFLESGVISTLSDSHYINFLKTRYERRD